MKFHLCRCARGYLISPECMQAPGYAQDRYYPARNIGTIEVDELPGPVATRVRYSVARDGWAYVGDNDVGRDDLDRMAFALDHRRQNVPTSALWG